MKMCPPSPRMAAYSGTNGCGEPKEKNVSASGYEMSVRETHQRHTEKRNRNRKIKRRRRRKVGGKIHTTQNKKRITTTNPPIPLTTVLQKIPRAAVTAAFFVSSATCPEASNPIRIPAVARNERHQFHASGAPVPLYVVKKASWADLNPMVRLVATGSQTMFKTKSRRTKEVER